MIFARINVNKTSSTLLLIVSYLCIIFCITYSFLLGVEIDEVLTYVLAYVLLFVFIAVITVYFISSLKNYIKNRGFSAFDNAFVVTNHGIMFSVHNRNGNAPVDLVKTITAASRK